LITSRVLAKVKTLNLYRNFLKDEGAIILANKNRLEKLEELDIAQNEIGDEGLIALSDSTRFPNLVAVYADNNFGSIEAQEDAREGENFKKLQSLNL
jgi:hypothetical protein